MTPCSCPCGGFQGEPQCVSCHGQGVLAQGLLAEPVQGLCPACKPWSTAQPDLQGLAHCPAHPASQHRAESPRDTPCHLWARAATVHPHSPEHAVLAQAPQSAQGHRQLCSPGRSTGNSSVPNAIKNNYCAPKLNRQLPVLNGHPQMSQWQGHLGLGSAP